MSNHFIYLFIFLGGCYRAPAVEAGPRVEAKAMEAGPPGLPRLPMPPWPPESPAP